MVWSSLAPKLTHTFMQNMIHKLWMVSNKQIFNLRVCYGSFVNWLFTKTKVGQFDMTLGIEQDIFRFEVTIDNALSVKMF